jgi:hypothetical protein
MAALVDVCVNAPPLMATTAALAAAMALQRSVTPPETSVRLLPHGLKDWILQSAVGALSLAGLAAAIVVIRERIRARRSVTVVA